MMTTGRCLCESITYEVHAPEKPLYSGLCHCKDCQRYTGAAFASSLMIFREQFSLFGELKYHGVIAQEGSIMERRLCPDCGSNILCRSEAWKNMYFLAAGTLDDTSYFRPRINIFVRSAMLHVWEIDKLKKIDDGV